MILVVADLWLPFPGGAERLIFNLARDLMRRGEDVTVLTEYARAQQFDGPPVVYEPIQVYERRRHGVVQVLDHVAKVKPDVILTHAFFASQFGAELVGTGIPVVQIMLNGQRQEGTAFAVYISQWVWDTYGGRDGDLLMTPPVFDDVVADQHGDLIGFVKPINHKGVALFYEVAKAMPDREFLVLRGEWYTLEDIRAMPNVRFMDPVDDMRDFYAECRVVLMPSRSEDAGTVAQECTVNSLPCVSSAVGGLNETNGGGLRIPPSTGRDLSAERDVYVQAIHYLDDPVNYAQVVENQHRWLAGTNQAGRLDEFAARMAELQRR